MPLEFVTGDLFASRPIRAYAHGCNCAGSMGKGIAVEFRNHWPEMFLEYKRLCAESQFNLGDVFKWKDRECTVFNLGTQKTWRTKAQLWAVEKSLSSMERMATEAGLKLVGLPRVGAGLGGLSWERVKQVMNDVLSDSRCRFVVFEDFVEGRPALTL